jgi:hypothetical protein
MLKTYRIIPLVFILFLFGFTLITVAPVFAQTEGTRIPKMGGLLMDGGIMGRSSATHAPSRQVIQSNARIAELEAENARLLEQQRASADQVVKHEQLKAEHSELMKMSKERGDGYGRAMRRAKSLCLYTGYQGKCSEPGCGHVNRICPLVYAEVCPDGVFC